MVANVLGENPPSAAALTLVSPAPLPLNEGAMIAPPKVLLVASSGTTDVSIVSVPLLVIGFGLAAKPPPVATATLVTVPLPPPVALVICTVPSGNMKPPVEERMMPFTSSG